MINYILLILLCILIITIPILIIYYNNNNNNYKVSCPEHRISCPEHRISCPEHRISCPEHKQCSKQEQLNIGDQVYFESTDGVQIGCINDIDKNNMANVCTFYSDGCSSYQHDNITSFHKTKLQHNIPCDYRYKDCKGIPNICRLIDGNYPGYDNTQFKTKQECETYFGTNNTWGKCVKHKDKFNMYWSLGCNTNNDCGNGRTCLDDENPLNYMKKICSCNSNNDCNFKTNSKNNSFCGGKPGILGKTSCPKK